MKSLVEATCKKAEGGDRFEVAPIPYGDKTCFAHEIQAFDLFSRLRIYFDDRKILINQLRLIIAETRPLMRNRLIDGTRNGHAYCLRSSQSHRAGDSRQDNLPGGPPAVFKQRPCRLVSRIGKRPRNLARKLCHQGARHRDLMDAILGERDPDGITDPIGEERADADGALDPSILAIPGLGHAKMNRIVPVGPLRIQTSHQQAIGGDHDLRIGGLHREDHRVKVEVACDPCKFQGALNHPEGGVPEAVHDPVAERSVIGSNAQCHTTLFAELHKRGETLPDALKLRLILGIAVVADIEFFRVGEIPGIDPYFLHPLRRLHRRLRLEMNVGCQWNRATPGIELRADVL